MDTPSKQSTILPPDRAKLLIGAIMGTIKDMGSEGCPSGVLYAGLLGKISLDTYQTIIDAGKRAKVIRESGHVLYWIGGE